MQNNNIDTNDLVTVVTVTYNAEELLEETIQSVINQSYKNIEYIIIDGSSTDSTIDIIKKYEDKIDYWISEPDDGLYFAMNKAIEKANGKWINFMNAGDTFFDHNIVEYVMNRQNKNAELVYGDYQRKNDGTIIKARDQSEWYTDMPFCHQALFAQTYIMKNELFDTSFKLAADHNFIIAMFRSNKKFQHINRTLAIFTDGGFAQSNSNIMNFESLKVLIDNKVPQEVVEKSIWYLRISHIEQIKQYQESIKNREDSCERKVNKLETFIERQKNTIINREDSCERKVNKLETFIERQKNTIINRENTIKGKAVLVDNLENQIKEQKVFIDNLESQIKEQKEIVIDKESEIEDLQKK